MSFPVFSKSIIEVYRTTVLVFSGAAHVLSYLGNLFPGVKNRDHTRYFGRGGRGGVCTVVFELHGARKGLEKDKRSDRHIRYANSTVHIER